LAGFSRRQDLDKGKIKDFVFRRMLPLLEELNIVFVTAAGNGGQNENPYALHETTPQSMSREAKYRSMIVVGGVHSDGS
jgi:hypothetical protein